MLTMPNNSSPWFMVQENWCQACDTVSHTTLVSNTMSVTVVVHLDGPGPDQAWCHTMSETLSDIVSVFTEYWYDTIHAPLHHCTSKEGANR